MGISEILPHWRRGNIFSTKYYNAFYNFQKEVGCSESQQSSVNLRARKYPWNRLDVIRVWVQSVLSMKTPEATVRMRCEMHSGHRRMQKVCSHLDFFLCWFLQVIIKDMNDSRIVQRRGACVLGGGHPKASMLGWTCPSLQSWSGFLDTLWVGLKSSGPSSTQLPMSPSLKSSMNQGDVKTQCKASSETAVVFWKHIVRS